MTKLFFVGAGTPTPTATRFGTCYIMNILEEYLMFDCGPASTYKMVKAGIFPTQIDHLFFSHHHFDHNADYPCFLLCRWDQSVGKERNLKVWGPPPTEWITQRLIGEEGAFNHDWKARVEHPGSQDIFVGRGGRLPRPSPKVDTRDIQSGDEISGDNWLIKTAKTRHIEPWMETLAYRVETDFGSLTILSDTGYCPSMVEFARGTDYLLAHCWGFQESMKNAEAAMITGTRDAGKLASEAAVGRLILSHLGPSLDKPGLKEKAIVDIAKTFEGEIIFAEELSQLAIWQE